MNSRLKSHHAARRLLALSVAVAGFLGVIGEHEARAFPTTCHTTPALWYGDCAYYEFGVDKACVPGPEGEPCAFLDILKVRWRGGTKAPGSEVEKWRLMYVRIYRVYDNALIWSTGWQPYQLNANHHIGGESSKLVNKRISSAHKINFKFEHVCNTPTCQTWNSWDGVTITP
jgi:hypothetical protein